jgi:TRAP-type mannitol/chloroaromatic compound transport system permease large subunit
MGAEVLSLAMFVVVCGVLLLGFPVAFSLAGTAFAFALVGVGFDIFDLRLLGGLSSRYFGVMTNGVLVAVPLFVFMGVMLERARIAEQLLETMGLLFGRLRGGLGLSVIFVGMLLAASTGIVGATVVTMGLLSLPTMLKAGYDPKLATGTICASGTLGQIIPPSIVLVLLGDILQGAYAEAQRAVGNWAPEPISVIDLFAGAFIPGMVLVGLYMAWIMIKAVIDPSSCPALVAEGEKVENLGGRVLTALLPPALLILAVLGSILGGIATPTEAAAVGSIGALFLAARSLRDNVRDDVDGVLEGFPRKRVLLAPFWLGRRLDPGTNFPVYLAGLCLLGQVALTSIFDLRMQRSVIPTADVIAFLAATIMCFGVLWGLFVALWRAYASGVLVEVMRTTMQISCMVFVILLGASVFSLVFRGFGGDEFIAEILGGLPGGVFTAMLAVMAVMFVLGFFLDFIEIIFVVVPIVGPILLQMDINPIWFGVMIAINLQTSFLTPPFGFALFYLRGVAPPSVTTMHIYRGILPFVLIQVVALALLAAFPELATWLPSVLFK